VSEEKTVSEYDIVYLHYVNEKNLGTCPQVKFLIGSHRYSAVLDTRCKASILSEQLYNELKANGVESLELPTQVFMTLKFGDIHIDEIFLVSESAEIKIMNSREEAR
jgi:hypothetical protein